MGNNSNLLFPIQTVLVDANHQPDEIVDLSDAPTKSQALNPSKPGMIERVGRHRVASFRKMVRETHLIEVLIPINYSVVIVSGSQILTFRQKFGQMAQKVEPLITGQKTSEKRFS